MINILTIRFRKWLPALLMMGIIFWFSSQPASNLPNFDWADKALKKGAHMLGYAILAWSYWYVLDLKSNKLWIAWLFAILYAMTDEYHQSFVISRFASVWDVVVFDNLGALISLSVVARWKKHHVRLSDASTLDASPLYPSHE